MCTRIRLTHIVLRHSVRVTRNRSFANLDLVIRDSICEIFRLPKEEGELLISICEMRRLWPSLSRMKAPKAVDLCLSFCCFPRQSSNLCYVVNQNRNLSLLLEDLGVKRAQLNACEVQRMKAPLHHSSLITSIPLQTGHSSAPTNLLYARSYVNGFLNCEVIDGKCVMINDIAAS
jgi:hypothetical protein